MNVAKIAPALALLGLFILLSGCATPTLSELEQEANRTGDWSEVERWEAREKARMDATTPVCPINMMNLCVKQGMQETCSCVRPGVVAQPLPEN
jgi:hypothetical protein